MLSLWYYHPSHLLCPVGLHLTKNLSFLLSLLLWALLKINTCSHLILSSYFQLGACRIKYNPPTHPPPLVVLLYYVSFLHGLAFLSSICTPSPFSLPLISFPCIKGGEDFHSYKFPSSVSAVLLLHPPSK